MNYPVVVDFDDLCDNTVDTLDILCALRAKYPQFKATIFTIPARCSEETIAKAREANHLAQENWMQLAPHGWRHTRGECLSWTDTEAVDKIRLAKSLGIDAPVFRAPAWLLDADVYDACGALHYVVASHDEFRVPNTGVKEYIYNHRRKHRTKFIGIHGHLTPVMGNFIRDMLHRGDLNFADDTTFLFPQDVAEVI